MKLKYKNINKYLSEGIIKICGSISIVLILLIVVFLFSEALGFFKHNIVEEGYVIAVSKKNPINSLSSQEIKDIFDENITRWQQLEDKERKTLKTEIRVAYTIQQALEIKDRSNLIAFLPEEFISEFPDMRKLECDNISLSDFFMGKEWYPTSQPSAQFGVLPILTGTLMVSLLSILIALPFAIASAIYLSELSNDKTYRILKPAIELLSGIPSVVYGFFGLVVIVPLIQRIFNLDVGETALSGAVVLAIMSLPTIITVAEDAMRTTPLSLREASLALGATKWQTIHKVVIPHSISGITAGVVLGIGRAIGETMAVLMVTGNASVLTGNILEPVRTIPASIAAELGEAPAGSAHYQALFVLACILFIITLIINLAVDRITHKSKK